MPVHRVPGGKRQAVFAFTDEIDAWLLSQEPQPAAGPAQKHPVIGKQKARAKLGISVAIGASLVAGVGIVGFILARSRGSTTIHTLSLHVVTDDGYQKEGLLTDGTTLYFSGRSGARLVVASASADGGPVHRIETTFTNVTLEDLSNDGTRLLIRSIQGIARYGELWVIPTGIGPPRRVG